MTNREDLEKLFDAALHDRQAPSRFGTPIEQRKTAPAAFQKQGSVFEKSDTVAGTAVSPFTADHAEAKPFVAAGANVFQAAAPADDIASSVVLDGQAASSLDQEANAEFGAIVDKKIAKEKAKRRRDRLMVYGLLIGAVGGGSWWLVNNPDKLAVIKGLAAELRSAMDPNAVADKYKESLDKVAERGNQIGDASGLLGGKVSEGDDLDFDKEMKDIAGEEAGLAPGERQKKLKEKFDSLPK